MSDAPRATRKRKRKRTALIAEVRDVQKHFPHREGLFGLTRKAVRAVDGVSLAVEEGETLGLVGESGCGKSTLGRVFLRLLDPTAGTVRFEDQDITTLGPEEMRPLRRRMQIIFQDPYSSLNPRLTVRATVGEAMRIHGLVKNDDEEEDRVAALLKRGWTASARATPMRWRWPPENSCG